MISLQNLYLSLDNHQSDKNNCSILITVHNAISCVCEHVNTYYIILYFMTRTHAYTSDYHSITKDVHCELSYKVRPPVH
jgi:hypothetical protein